MPVVQNRIGARRNSVGALKDLGSHKVEHVFDQLFTNSCLVLLSSVIMNNKLKLERDMNYSRGFRSSRR